MDISSYLLSIENKDTNGDYRCAICFDGCDCGELINLTCDHVFHKSCIKMHIEAKINCESEKIKCPLVTCNDPISDTIICNLIDNELILKYKKNKITHDENYCICKICAQSYCRKNTHGKFIDYCKICDETHCFQCGKKHSGELNCFEADEQSKQMIYNAYKNKGSILKSCPHCYLPQEKLGGCNSMVCGKNTDDVNMKIHGCGKKFDWNKAKIFTTDIESNSTDIESNLTDIELDSRSIINQQAINGETDNDCIMRNIPSRFLLVVLLVLTGLLIYYSYKTNHIVIKHKDVRDKYCYTQFEFVDENFINSACLNDYNLTEINYLACFNNGNCWNQGDNIYSNSCLDEKAKYYDKMCKKYIKFYEKHDYVYYCNHKPKYDDIYVCDKNCSKYFTITCFIAVISLVDFNLYLIYLYDNVELSAHENYLDDLYHLIKFVSFFSIIAIFLGLIIFIRLVFT